MNLEAASVRNPLTPEQSKAQVVDAARDIVRALNLHVVEASFAHSSCNDQGEAPFRGEMRIAYPLAPSFEASDAEVAGMVQRLQGLGWTGDPAFHSHSPVLQKNNVAAVFRSQNVSTPTRGIELLGECRDVTTTKKDAGTSEHVNLT
jgi:hypothetical protein